MPEPETCSTEKPQPDYWLLGSSATLLVRIFVRKNERFVVALGELDIASCDALFDACTDGDDVDVVLDVRAVTFMDSGGYDGVTSARTLVEKRGHSLTVRGVAGQPARLVKLLSAGGGA
jgi:anti-anti-sigma factor